MRPSADGLADVAQEVFRRLSCDSEAVVLRDPHGYLMSTAAQVEREWEERARWSGHAAGRNALPHCAPTVADVRAAVNALPASVREILRLHLEGLTCQEISQRAALTRDDVLQELVSAYRHLRRELVRDE